MERACRYIAITSSLSVRLLSYVFLRWIPGHPFPPLIATLVLIYFGSILFPTTPRFLLVSSKPEKQSKTGSASPRPASIAWALFSGLPCSNFCTVNWLTVLLNIALLCSVVDLTYGPKWYYPSEDLSFARVGFVGHDSARILVRERDFRHRLSYRVKATSFVGSTNDWNNVSAINYADISNDHTAVYHLEDLSPSTEYEYQALHKDTGTFVTGPEPGAISSTFTFLHSSCVVPNFPYLPFRHHLSFPGFKHMAHLLPTMKAQLMLFLGDFIYIDVPRRHGTDRESYRREYRQVYASPDWPSVSAYGEANVALPWIHVLDDHEISNDWDKNETGVYKAAFDPFAHYQGSVNPPSVRSNASYYSFTQGPASFFLLDTRRYRNPFDGTPGYWTDTSIPIDERKSMLGSQQRDDLLAWLARRDPPGVRWKVLVSSIPFTKNWRFGSEDTWAGYLGERKLILEAMWDAAQDNGCGIIVLSGDRHEFAATKFPPPEIGTTVPSEQAGSEKEGRWAQDVAVHEFSASPLSMFYLPVRTYRQDDSEDAVLKYLPDGNSKLGAVHIRESGRLDYQVFIDGQETWSYTLPPPGAKKDL